MKKKWKTNEIDLLIKLFYENKTYEEIGIKLNRTSKSIKLKLYRLNLKYSDINDIKKKIISCECTQCGIKFNRCKSEIKTNDSKNLFCSNSCAATYNNKIYVKRKRTNARKRREYNKRKSNKCLNCGWNEKHPITNKIPIELEHKDGNSKNNDLSNLKLLCPNCHSLTPTYRALNSGNGREKRRLKYYRNK